MSNINVKPQGNSEYSRVNWLDRANKCLVALSAHRWTNPQEKDGKTIRYLHNHFSVYLNTLIDGAEKLKGVLDFVHSVVKPQMQIEYLDMVFKTPNSRLIKRDSETSKFYEIKIVRGELVVEEIDKTEIRFASEIKEELN